MVWLETRTTWKGGLTPWVIAPGDTNPSDATKYMKPSRTKHFLLHPAGRLRNWADVSCILKMSSPLERLWWRFLLHSPPLPIQYTHLCTHARAHPPTHTYSQDLPFCFILLRLNATACVSERANSRFEITRRSGNLVVRWVRTQAGQRKQSWRVSLILTGLIFDFY